MFAPARAVPALILAGLSLSLTAFAATPRINLRLENVTADEALRALGKETQTPLRMYSLPLGSPRAGFDWKNVSLDRALRDVCGRFSLACAREAPGYSLYPVGSSGRSEHAFIKGGVRIALSGVAVQVRRKLRSEPGPGPAREPSGRVVLSFLVDLDEAHGDWTAVLENVVAKDSNGKSIPARSTGRMDPTLPHQRRGSATVDLYGPPPTRYSGIEGVLVLTQWMPAKRVELPFPAPRELQKRAAGTEVTVGALQPRLPSKTPAMDYPALSGTPLALRAFDVEKGPAVVMVARQPVNVKNPDASDFFPSPRGVGASGKSYYAASTFGGSRRKDRWSIVHREIHFPEAKEPLQKLVWELPGEEAGQARIPFSIAEAPLPKQTGLPIQMHLVNPEEANTAVPAVIRQAGGGALRSTVRVGDAVGPAGVLRLSLSRFGGVRWEPSSWFETPVNDAGIAEIRDLAPGRYRLLREFRLTDYAMAHAALRGRTASPAGAWQGAETEIEIKAGTVTEATPLVLSAANDRVTTVGGTQRSSGSIGAEVTHIDVGSGRAEIWEGPHWLTEFHARGSLHLSGRVVSPQRDGDRWYVRRISALDDRGTATGGGDELPAFTRGQFSDEKRPSFQVNLSAVHPRARALDWIEGEVYAFTRKRRVTLEMPYPEVGRNNVAQDGPDLIVTAALDGAPKRPELAGNNDDLFNLFDLGVPAQPEQRVRIRVCYRGAVLQIDPKREVIFPVAVGKSGAVYEPAEGGGHGATIGEWVLHARRARYLKATEPLERLRWEFDIVDTPKAIGVFRLENVVLPAATPAGQ